MRFEKHEPNIGDVESKYVFLLFPRTLFFGDTKQTRWLEFATIKRTYERYNNDWLCIPLNIGKWSEWKWDNP